MERFPSVLGGGGGAVKDRGAQAAAAAPLRCSSGSFHRGPRVAWITLVRDRLHITHRVN